MGQEKDEGWDMVYLENEKLKVAIQEKGAELTSIVKKETQTEYLWNADPVYWKRHAPVLFPIVGAVKGDSYRYDGKEYKIEKHGFARDMEFTVVNAADTEAWFRLDATEETKKKFPFAFRLEIGYKLCDDQIETIWKVSNQDDKQMYFSIGGHPAFLCPLANKGKQSDYYLKFDTKKDLQFALIDPEGLVISEDNILKNENGYVPITENMFDNDALIIEKNQAHQVSLCDPQKQPYLTVTFDAPLFGVWSPDKKQAPFVCIEPWYGRCDKKSFTGTLEEREYGNSLCPGEVFEKQFSVRIH